MAGSTKTLGVKFQIAGVKEAQAGLDNLRKNLNASLKQNKQAVNQSLGLNKTVRQELEQSNPDDFVDNYQRTVAAIRNKQYRQAVNIYARPRVNKVSGGFYEGIGNAAGARAFNQLDNLFRKLTGREEYRESVDLSTRTIQRIGVSVRDALTGRSGASATQRERNLGKGSPGILQQETLVDKAINQALMPLKTVQYSFFEGIGSFFGNQFAEGMSGILNDELDFSMNRKGQVTGKAISYTATTGINNFKGDVSATGDNYNDFRYAVEDGNVEQVSQKFDTLFKSVTKSITSIADSYLRGFRKGSVQLEALRKIDAEVAKLDNVAPDLTGKKKVIYTVGGFAGDKGQRGKAIASQIKPLINADTEVIGADNSFTDVNTSAQKNTLMWGVNSLANIAKINLKGFNPDAVKLASQVINTLAKNPDVVVDLIGHSAGGYVVEEAQEILNLLGKGNKVKSKTVGTPNVRGGLNADKTTKIVGDRDPFLDLERQGEYLGVSSPTQNIANNVKDHSFQAYLNSDDFVNQILGDSLDPEKLKAQRQKNSKFQGKLIELETLYSRYISTIYQDLDELGEELSVAPDRLIAKKRRGRLRDRGGNLLQRKLENRDFKEINLKENTKTAVLVSGGFGGARGRSGATFAKRLNSLVDDDFTQYVGVRNPFTDVLSPDDVRNPDTEKMIPKVLEMFGEVHKLGYNPDAVEIAAQAMDLLAKDPNLKVKVAGYSGGGYVAEDVMELLSSQNADMSRVELMGIGTPNLPGGIKNRDFKKILGEKDDVVAANQLKDINNEVKKILGFDIFPELMTKLQNVEGVETHDLDEYVANSKEVQDFLYGHIPDSGELIENYAEIGSLQKETSDLNSEMTAISEDQSLEPAKKLKRLHEIRERYVKLLKQIHTLAKYSESIGGGKAFAEERELAAIELEDAGVIVDPIRVQISDDDPWKDAEPEEQEVINNRAQQLAAQYRAYLQNIIDSNRNSSKFNSQFVARDFGSLNKQGQKDYLATIRRTFNTKARQYRESVKSGQLEVAKQQGEDLLQLSALIQTLYDELADFDTLDPEVKNSFSGYRSYITSVQNEVISGSRGNGRTEVGLPENFANQLNLEQNGSDTAEGFIDGILDALDAARDAGVQLIDAVDEGIREQGEIQSPSKLAKRLGKWFAQGFGLGMAAENLEERGREVVEDAANGFKDQIKQSIDSDNIASLLDTGGAELIKKIGSLLFDASQNDQFDEVLGIFSKLIGKVIRLVVTFKLLKVGLDALGLGKFISAFQNLPEKALDAAIAVESLDKRINDMSGSAVQGAENLSFISEEAQRLNKNLTEAKDNYSQILGSTRDTSLEGFLTENIYSAFAATAKNKGLSSTAESEIFRSVRSIIGKDILSQEEVRQEIGEKLGDFEKSLADAYGVSRPQLNAMISNREIRATEALPKVAAVLSAKNDIGGISTTGAAAAQRLDNAIVSFQESVGGALLPLQKFGNNFLAGFFNKLAGWIDEAKGLIHGFFFALFANLLRLEIFGQTVQKMLLGLIKLLWTMKGAMGIFLAEMLLIAAAWKAWENVIKIFNSRFFPEINKDIDQLTRGMKAYRQAIEEANESQTELGNGKLQLAEGFKLPENKIGDAIRGAIGSDYLNLDSLIREPLDKLLGNKFLQGTVKTGLNFIPGGQLLQPFVPISFNTRREQKEQQLKIDNSRLSAKGNQLLAESGAASTAAQEITKLDAEIAEIQSARLRLLPGDADALKASLAEEKKINQERDKQLRILAKYQQTLQTSINVYKTRLEDVEQRFLNGEIDQSTYDFETNNLTGLLDATEAKLKGINSELNKVSKNLSIFQRRLRNSNERVEGFLAQSDRELQLQRAAIIENGIANGDGTQTIQIELEEAQQQDLQRRINFIKGELTDLERDLKSPELAEGVRRVKQRFKDSNVPINETTLQRIIEESTVKADRDAAEGLLKELRERTKLAGLSEQLANTLQQNRTALKDFNRTIDDYFFNINQQIKEAQIEVLRVIDQIIQTNIRNKLQSALSPNANSFVNTLISSTQSLLDQAASYTEKLLGQRQARVQFESQQRSLQLELQDFARNVKGAGDALIEFQQRLKGEAPAKPAPNLSDNPSAKSSDSSQISTNTLPVPSLPVIRGSGQLPPPPPIADAEQLNNQLIDKQQQRLDLQDSLIANQEKESLDINIENNIKSDRQKVDFNITDSQFALDKLLDAGEDLAGQYNFQSATSEAEKSLRAFNTAFSDRAQQISREIIKYTDEINAINDLKSQAPSNIRFLRQAGRNNEADILEEKTAQATLLLKPYQEILQSLTTEYGNVTQAAETALEFVNSQNELKKQQEKISQRSLLVNQQATLAEQRGTVEAQRKVKLHQEDLRLHLEILKLKQEYPEGELLDSLIKGERRQSQVNTENINYDWQIKELELEKRFLDYQTQIGEKRAGLLSRFGVDFGAEKIKKHNAIAQENLRLERELIELRKQYVDQPDLLAEFTANAEELNRVNLSQIENQFISLGKVVQDAFVSATQGFFDQFTTNFFDGKSQRDQQVLQERLQYAEELVQLENQYRDQPGKLYHLKSRAKELNEQKLDQISGQFNIFKRAVDLGRQALLEFVKQPPKMAAQQAAVKFLSSIIGGAIGGIGGGGVPSVGNDFGSNAAGVSAFVADEGATVGDIKQRKIGDRATNYLRRTFPGVANAWNSEGEGAQLGVFHTGEELLSRKTGEAGRYQALKQQLGINPLAKIGVFADGGTVGFDAGSNILAGFGDYSPRIDLSALNEGRGQRADGRREIHLIQNISTPDQDSFMLNGDQRNQDLIESLQRSF